jgi:hypothetical protein
MDEPLPARTLWPIRPWPMPDELLSSWLNRVAVANGLAPRSFRLALAKTVRWKSILTRSVLTNEKRRIQVKESCWVDLRCESRTAEYLAQRSGLPVRLIQSLALRRPHDVPAGTPTPANTLQWELIEALPNMIRPDEDSQGYMRFCPYCLAEWDDPWFRKVWRTSLARVCTRHACHLLFNCVCGKSIRPHLTRTPRSQAFCYRCNQDLRRLDAKPALPHELRAQKERYRRAYEEVERIVRNGNDHALIVGTIRKPIPDDVLYLWNKPTLDLRKTGLIDAYGKNSALSLWLIYRDVRRSNAENDVPSLREVLA